MNDGIYLGALILIGLGELGLGFWAFKSGNIKACLMALEERLNKRIDSVKEDLGKKIEILDKRLYNHISDHDHKEKE